MPRLPQFRSDLNACLSPHVYILGAGASLAAFPDGDRNGRKLPLMHNLVEVVGLADVLDAENVEHQGRNFEALYDELASDPSRFELARKVEQRVRLYFESLELPAEVTLYDELILSLRAKDLIATFNWDPFLLQAYMRNTRVGELPRIVFLHGNVLVGVCTSCRVKGVLGQRCNGCRDYLEETKLLYPVKHKNYTDDPFIKAEWDELLDYLEHAYLLSIFGYSAPVSDAEARAMLESIWAKNESRDLAEVFIIDIRDEHELENNWRPFFVRNHFGISPSVDRSWNFSYARRSCDAFAMATLMVNPCKDNPLPRFRDLGDLQYWVAPLIDAEQALKLGKPFECH